MERVREVLREEGVEAEVMEVNVSDPATAQAVGFLGSPSIRFNGFDIEHSARLSQEYRMVCRTYAEGQRRAGFPSKDLIRAAVREILVADPGTQGCCQVVATTVHGEPGRSRRPTVFLASSIIAAALASFCCILPIVFVLTGLTVVGAAAAFAAWRPYLLGVTFGLLGLGFYFAYRTSREVCAPDSVCAVPAMRRRIRMTLWLATILVLVLAAFPYFSDRVAEWLLSANTVAPNSPKSIAAGQTARLGIEGAHRTSSATTIENKLAAVQRVRHGAVSFDRGVAGSKYDPGADLSGQFDRPFRRLAAGFATNVHNLKHKKGESKP